MIAAYEAGGRSALLDAPRQYALGQTHKHLPEMAAACGLETAPVFCPIVAPYYAGMEVTVPLTPAETSAAPDEIRDVYRSYYTTGLVRYAESAGEEGFLSAGALAGRDDLEISVFGCEERILLVSRIQNMNLVLGVEETLGLTRG